MRGGPVRLIAVAACAAWLAGCESSGLTDSASVDAGIVTSAPLGETTGSVEGGALATGGEAGPVKSALYGSDPSDDLSLGKRHYREQNYGLAEKHFRRVVEAQPRTAEAWVGLAASYDRLRRFDLADRAYEQAIGIIGPTPEILNNQGYSYMLRGDYKTARKKLLAAQVKDPGSKYIQANLELLDEVTRNKKGIK